MVKRYTISLVVGCVASAGAHAAEIKSSALRDGRIIISITGEIVPGDLDAFKAAVKTANDAGKLASSIRLNSIGGNLIEGVKLADAVRFAKMATNVGQNAVCASACFLIFAAGETKYANYTAQIGVHGASDKTGEETVQSGAATVSMARVAKELGVPSSIIGRMVVTPPSDMVWLSPSDLQSMGTSMVGKPSQVAPASSAPSIDSQVQAGPPMQLQPTAKASAPPAWDRLVNAAVALSAEQNGGNAISVRACQPKFKTCFNGVMYRDNKGVDTMLKVTRNLDDKIIRREACTFNKSGDIRKCLDWDTNESRRDMKDTSGNWFKVADD